MQQQETLSAYMDGHNVNGEFTDTLCRDAKLQQKWANYHTIRSVMRDEPLLLGADFSAKMEALIEQENIAVAAPAKKQGRVIQLKRWTSPLWQAGIAASVCLVAVFGVNSFNSSNEVAQTAQPVLQTLPFSQSVQPVSYNAPAKDQPTAEQLEYQQHRINVLLQNHELQRRLNINHVLAPNEAQKSQAQTSSTENTQQK